MNNGRIKKFIIVINNGFLDILIRINIKAIVIPKILLKWRT